MTRRKKTKSVASQNAPSGVTGPVPIAAKASATVISRDNNINTPTIKHSLPACDTVRLSTTSTSAATSSTPHSSNPSSAVSEVASTTNSEPNEKASKHPKGKKKPVNVKVTYVTEQIHIYPMYPVLTVERLPNFDYHINMLTESIGRRPRVYQHGKGVRFIPESNDEYRTLQRYLAKIESAERIAWCSYTVPRGNSLKVNVKVRKVEVLKVTEYLQKLNIENDSKPSIARPKDTLHKDTKLSTKDSSLHNGKLTTSDLQPKEVKLSSKDYSIQNDKLTTRDFPPKELKIPTKDFSTKDLSASSELKEGKPVELVSKGLRLPAKKKEAKKPRDIAQNRSYKKRQVY